MAPSDVEKTKQVQVELLAPPEHTNSQLAKWTVVRGFGSVKYFNISYAVLAFVPILYQLQEKSAYLVSVFGGLAPLPVTFKWLYAASLFYAFAILIYQVFCPKEIKRFGEVTDYVKHEYELFCRANPYHRLNIILPRLDAKIDRVTLDKIDSLQKNIRESQGADRDRAGIELSEYLGSLHGDAVQRYLEQDYDHKNASWPVARWFSFLLYVSGSLILLLLLALRSYDIFFEPWKNQMLIQTSIEHSELRLDAYTFDAKEFDALRRTLISASAGTEYQSIEEDDSGREGRRYIVLSGQIPKLQIVLGGSFDPQGKFAATAGSGTTYACHQIVRGGAGPGCKELVASDDHVASTKCAIIAGTNRWWGGVAQPGKCPARRGLLGSWGG